jgi:hypothetical protein
MTRIKFLSLLLFLSLPLCLVLKSQATDPSLFKLDARLSFYSFEKNGEFLLKVPRDMLHKSLSVTLRNGSAIMAEWKGVPAGQLVRIPFKTDLAPGQYRITAGIAIHPEHYEKYKAFADLLVLPYKPNEVKTDRLTGGMIVNRRQFFPFGFYCYSPVPSSLPEEEIVRGFNMISPYQAILPETLGERKAYMDRCAQIGMKVHFNLLSVSGGGGVNSLLNGLGREEKRKRLVEEIKTFMDHPALLAWYISDEPNGYRIPPDSLEEIYNIVKSTDPWHPVSMVFMAPFLDSRKYAGALDIVMADPYPVPNYPVSMVGNVAKQLKSEFTGKKAVWMVLQSFGGGEWWEREPTLQEIRSMTWQSVVNGATGIQYFVRQGLNYFPKSLATWNECGRMAMEIAELTPWLLSDEETMKVESSSENILASSRIHDGQLMIMVVNKVNAPGALELRIRGINSGKARVIFENRTVTISRGEIRDFLPPYGSQVYMIDISPRQSHSALPGDNLLMDPGFESAASPGVPSACYARPGGDNGATYFVDSREHHEGNHSLRLTTPVGDKGITIRLFPIKVKAGCSYAISLWAKSDPEQRFFTATNQENLRLYAEKPDKQYVEIEMGIFGKARFSPDNEWKRYMTFFSVPADTLKTLRTNLVIRMPGQGVAWFDDLKVYEEK